MHKMLPLKEAAALIGISAWELARGARAGIYPHIKIGEGRGKYLFNVELLLKELDRMALSNISKPEDNVTPFGIRRIR